VARGTFFRIVHSNDPLLIRESTLQRIAEKVSEIVGEEITIDELINNDLSVRFPIECAVESEESDYDEIIAMLRNARKMSYREVAKMSRKIFKDKERQVSPTYVYRLEKGDFKSPSLSKLETLFSIYGIPMDIIYTMKKRRFGLLKDFEGRLIIDLSHFDDRKRNKIKKEIQAILENNS